MYVSFLLSEKRYQEAKAYCEHTPNADIALLEGLVLYHHGYADSKSDCKLHASEDGSCSQLSSQLTERVRPALESVFSAEVADSLGLGATDIKYTPKMKWYHVPSWETMLNLLLVKHNRITILPDCIDDYPKFELLCKLKPDLKVGKFTQTRLMQRSREAIALIEARGESPLPFLQLYDAIEADDFDEARRHISSFPQRTLSCRLLQLGYPLDTLTRIGLKIANKSIIAYADAATVAERFDLGKRPDKKLDKYEIETLCKRSPEFWVQLNSIRPQVLRYCTMLLKSKQRASVVALVKSQPDVGSALAFEYPFLLDIGLSEDNLLAGLTHYPYQVPCSDWTGAHFAKIKDMPRLLRALVDKTKDSSLFKILFSQ